MQNPILGARGSSCAVSSFGFGLRPTKLLVAREKKPLVPRVPETLIDSNNFLSFKSFSHNLFCTCRGQYVSFHFWSHRHTDKIFVKRQFSFPISSEQTVVAISLKLYILGLPLVFAVILCRTLYIVLGDRSFSRLKNERGTGAEMCPTIVSGIVSGDALVSYWPIFPLCLVTIPEAFARVRTRLGNPRKPLKTLECQKSDFKALKVLEFRFRSLKVLEFLLNKIENVLHNL